jgi:hypothetical protein
MGIAPTTSCLSSMYPTNRRENYSAVGWPSCLSAVCFECKHVTKPSPPKLKFRSRQKSCRLGVSTIAGCSLTRTPCDRKIIQRQVNLDCLSAFAVYNEHVSKLTSLKLEVRAGPELRGAIGITAGYRPSPLACADRAYSLKLLRAPAHLLPRVGTLSPMNGPPRAPIHRGTKVDLPRSHSFDQTATEA